ncbi:hypothetical protein [Bacillus velezensis]|uniref:hypothetical protein n=1 Tax=Bacillus velezensis TaxID=492670 RepID=UPI00155B31F7|nr:hypothetical protein [Bacillus velezensis]QKF32441.1 hypothetical protein HPQ66_02585 [Bacillus velezensis]
MSVLDTRCVNQLYLTLSNILSISESDLRQYVIDKKFELLDIAWSEIDIDEFFKTVKSNVNRLKGNIIESVTISHLSSRLEYECNKENIYNLYSALTGETKLRKYLSDVGIECIHESDVISVFFHGERIDWKQYEQTPVVLMLQKRLGVTSSGDKCINGFLFSGDIHKNMNVTHIARIPEFLENLLRILKVHEAIYFWERNAQPYEIIFKEKFSGIIYDGDDSLSLEDKNIKTIKHCISFLGRNLFNEWNQNDNPIIRLKDDNDVLADQIISSRNLKTNRIIFK